MQPIVNPWINEPRPYDLKRDKSGEWNIMSAEEIFCNFAGALARMTLSKSVIVETGMGQGYTTRRLPHETRNVLVYETDDEWIELWQASGSLWPEVNVIKGAPDIETIKAAKLLILDSHLKEREEEWFNWVWNGQKDSWCLMHDTFHRIEANSAVWQWVKDIEIPHLLLDNPRGSYLGVHP